MPNMIAALRKNANMASLITAVEKQAAHHYRISEYWHTQWKSAEDRIARCNEYVGKKTHYGDLGHEFAEIARRLRRLKEVKRGSD